MPISYGKTWHNFWKKEGTAVIDFYTYPTVNGKAVAITLEAVALPYQTHLVDLTKGQQYETSFKQINPSGRIPVIVDHVNEKPLVVTQTGAIMIYLAEQTGQYLGRNSQEKAQILSWLCFQLTDITTNFFNNFYLKSLVSPKQPEAGEMLKQRALKFYHEFDQQLADNPFIAGDSLSLADMAAYPVVSALQEVLAELSMPHLMRWFQDMSQNTAVMVGMKTVQS